LPALLAAAGIALAGCGSGGGGSTAATVNGQTISMTAYNKEFSYDRVAAEDNYNFDVCSTKATAPLCAEVKRTALNDLIGNALVDQYAARHHIVVTNADFQRRWAEIDAAKFHDDPAVVTAYAKRYGWSVADFKASIRHDILEQKVMLALTRHMPLYVPAVKMSRIDVSTTKEESLVQARLHTGVPFARIVSELASNKKSLCHTPRNCGEVGWLPTAFLPPADSKAATAAPGTVIGPVSGQNVFEFLQVERHNQNYLMTAAEQYRYRQQLFSAWLAGQQRHAAITRHIQV
jgi:parvulin-like peptidyl-prolyl isomerase